MASINPRSDTASSFWHADRHRVSLPLNDHAVRPLSQCGTHGQRVCAPALRIESSDAHPLPLYELRNGSGGQVAVPAPSNSKSIFTSVYVKTTATVNGHVTTVRLLIRLLTRLFPKSNDRSLDTLVSNPRPHHPVRVSQGRRSNPETASLGGYDHRHSPRSRSSRTVGLSVLSAPSPTPCSRSPTSREGTRRR